MTSTRILIISADMISPTPAPQNLEPWTWTLYRNPQIPNLNVAWPRQPCKTIYNPSTNNKHPTTVQPTRSPIHSHVKALTTNPGNPCPDNVPVQACITDKDLAAQSPGSERTENVLGWDGWTSFRVLWSDQGVLCFGWLNFFIFFLFFIFSFFLLVLGLCW